MSEPFGVDYDVAVVGAGPGGAATAYRLAMSGHRVLLIDRERLPRYKVCGGGVTRKALAEIPFSVEDVLEQGPTVARVAMVGRDPVEVHTLGVAAWTAMRDRFDARIAREAVAAGVELVEGCRAIGVENGLLVTDRGPIRSRVIVGADGAPSRIARSVGLAQGRRQTPAVEAEVEVDRAVVDRWKTTVLFDFGAAPGGYGWIFPKADHLSIGLCSLSGKVDGLREKTLAYVESLLPGTLWTARSLKGHLLPVGGPLGPIHRDNVVLVGDAAGLVDPFLGEGIYYALRSARAASDAIDRYLRGLSADLSGYSLEMTALLGREFDLADRLGRFIFGHLDLSHRLFMRNRRVARLFTDVVSGDRTYRGFIRSCFANPVALIAGYLGG